MSFIRQTGTNFKPPKSKPRSASKTAEETRHMDAVASLPCLICGAWPVEVHHCPSPRSNLRVLPLCPRHHRREYGPGAYHYSRRAFQEAHGTDEQLLARVAEMIRNDDDEILGRLF